MTDTVLGAVTGRATDVARVDWSRLEELYLFARARARDRILRAEQRADQFNAVEERFDLRTLETMYAEARRDSDVAECAHPYFEMKALRDSSHPDFRAGWVGSTSG